MAKQVKIKDIAQMAGVSAGTVDRILHHRGNVSAKSREAVEKVLSEVGYKYNIHTSAISLKKEFKIVISIPDAEEGEYWGLIRNGFELALDEYSDISIESRYHFYNQFDIYSCREAFVKVLDGDADAVIIGQTFAKETQDLCSELDRRSIPYVFVDSIAEDTNPLESFTTDQYVCGYLLGKLLDTVTPENSSFAIFNSQRTGNGKSSNSLRRRDGFLEYMKESGQSEKIKETSFSALKPEEAEETLLHFIKDNPDVKGIAVLNSRGYILADILHKNAIEDIRIVSFDLTDNNKRGLLNGNIAALLCQRPMSQGFNAVKATINKLLYNRPVDKVIHLMPIDLIFKENLPFYKEI